MEVAAPPDGDVGECSRLYAGKPGRIHAVLVFCVTPRFYSGVMKGSNNPMVSDRSLITPENQQERLENVGWVVGFVDGEGCFSCSIYRCHKMTLKWQVRPSFDVVQGASSRDVLEDLVRFFDCGRIYRNRRRDNHREDLFRFCVYRFDDLRSKIVPFFQEHPLRTAKRENFQKFAQILELMAMRRHLTIPGVREIAEIAQTMNHRKPSEVLRILRDHTPALF